MKVFILIFMALLFAATIVACRAESAADPEMLDGVERNAAADVIEAVAEPEDTAGDIAAPPPVEATPEVVGVDRTAQMEDTIDITGKDVVSEFGARPEFGVIYHNADELSEAADYVAIGEVIDVMYTDYNAAPRIYYNFKISQPLRGDFGTGDIITVGEFGGYIRGDVYASVFGNEHFDYPLTEDVLLRYSFYGMPEPAVGDKYALFFGDSEMLEGTYAIRGAFMGKYYIGDGPADGDSGEQSVSRYTPEGEPYLPYFYGADPNLDDAATLSEVIAAVAEHSD